MEKGKLLSREIFRSIRFVTYYLIILTMPRMWAVVKARRIRLTWCPTGSKNLIGLICRAKQSNPFGYHLIFPPIIQNRAFIPEIERWY